MLGRRLERNERERNQAKRRRIQTRTTSEGSCRERGAGGRFCGRAGLKNPRKGAGTPAEVTKEERTRRTERRG